MANSSDFANIPGMTREMRDGVIAALNAVSNWRDEADTANERCLGKVLDRTSAIARSMGWPDQAVRVAREYMEKTSNSQVAQRRTGWRGKPWGYARNFPVVHWCAEAPMPSWRKAA